MAVLAEELQKRGADIVNGLHISPTRKTRNKGTRHSGGWTALFSGSALPCPVRRKAWAANVSSFMEIDARLPFSRQLLAVPGEVSAQPHAAYSEALS